MALICEQLDGKDSGADQQVHSRDMGSMKEHWSLNKIIIRIRPMMKFIPYARSSTICTYHSGTNFLAGRVYIPVDVKVQICF